MTTSRPQVSYSFTQHPTFPIVDRFPDTGMIQRSLAMKSKPTIEITENGGRWTIKRLTALKNSEVNFQLGQEFEFENLGGAKVMAVINLVDGKLVEKHHGDDVAPVVATWTFSSTDLTVESTARGVVGIEVFKRL